MKGLTQWIFNVEFHQNHQQQKASDVNFHPSKWKRWDLFLDVEWKQKKPDKLAVIGSTFRTWTSKHETIVSHLLNPRKWWENPREGIYITTGGNYVLCPDEQVSQRLPLTFPTSQLPACLKFLFFQCWKIKGKHCWTQSKLLALKNHSLSLSNSYLSFFCGKNSFISNRWLFSFRRSRRW